MKPYHDLDALDDTHNLKAGDVLSSRPTTSYRDLTDDRSLSPSPPPSPNQISSPSFLHTPAKIPTENRENEEGGEEQDEEVEDIKPTETFYNQTIPYPVVNDKRDLEIVNRQLKNQLRQFEASKSNPLFDQQSNLTQYERLKKQNEYINIRMRIEKLKKFKGKTQREKEQNKKQFHALLQVCLTNQ